jgi:hypothetical protein
LITIDNATAVLYSEDRRDAKPILYSDDDTENASFLQMKICGTHVAFCGKFFAIGLVDNERSLLGIFSFNKATWSIKPLTWINKFDFSSFYMDDCMTTVMFLDHSRRRLDYNFIMWKYDTTKLDHALLSKFDKAADANNNDSEIIKHSKKQRRHCLLF